VRCRQQVGDCSWAFAGERADAENASKNDMHTIPWGLFMANTTPPSDRYYVGTDLSNNRFFLGRASGGK
jgi:hypothetical protein